MFTGKFKIIIWVIAVLAIVLAGCLFFSKLKQSKSASISFGSTRSVKLSEEQVIPIIIDTNGTAINAAEVYLKYNPDLVEVISVSKENSFFTLWITDSPTFSNEKGEISFAGGLPTPGFNGKGQIGSIKIKAKKLGQITFEFDSKTRALKNDGVGSQLNLKLAPLILKVKK